MEEKKRVFDNKKKRKYDDLYKEIINKKNKKIKMDKTRRKKDDETEKLLNILNMELAKYDKRGEEGKEEDKEEKSDQKKKKKKKKEKKKKKKKEAEPEINIVDESETELQLVELKQFIEKQKDILGESNRFTNVLNPIDNQTASILEDIQQETIDFIKNKRIKENKENEQKVLKNMEIVINKSTYDDILIRDIVETHNLENQIPKVQEKIKIYPGSKPKPKPKPKKTFEESPNTQFDTYTINIDSQVTEGTLEISDDEKQEEEEIVVKKEKEEEEFDDDDDDDGVVDDDQLDTLDKIENIKKDLLRQLIDLNTLVFTKETIKEKQLVERLNTYGTELEYSDVDKRIFENLYKNFKDYKTALGAFENEFTVRPEDPKSVNGIQMIFTLFQNKDLKRKKERFDDADIDEDRYEKFKKTIPKLWDNVANTFIQKGYKMGMQVFKSTMYYTMKMEFPDDDNIGILWNPYYKSYRKDDNKSEMEATLMTYYVNKDIGYGVLALDFIDGISKDLFYEHIKKESKINEPALGMKPLAEYIGKEIWVKERDLGKLNSTLYPYALSTEQKRTSKGVREVKIVDSEDYVDEIARYVNDFRGLAKVPNAVFIEKYKNKNSYDLGIYISAKLPIIIGSQIYVDYSYDYWFDYRLDTEEKIENYLEIKEKIDQYFTILTDNIESIPYQVNLYNIYNILEETNGGIEKLSNIVNKIDLI